MTTIGIIGGTGLYALEGLSNVQELSVDTPFGATSDTLITGDYAGTRVIFVPRHGRGHRHLPSEVPFRANLFALKSLGAQWVISVSAVGSMRETLHPGDIAIPAQFIDRTHLREGTFFGNGVVGHVSLADPTCTRLAATLEASVRACNIRCHPQATYICIEGPAFSTRAESNLYRQWGVDVIGMTAMPEARLAREAELHYAVLALATDYDCWHQNEADVTVDAVMATLSKNTANVRRVLAHALPAIATLPYHGEGCGCDQALASAILTHHESIPAERRQALAPLLGNRLT